MSVYSLGDVYPLATRLLIGTRALSSGGLEIGSAHAYNVQTANTITYLIDGVFYSKGAADGLFSLPATASVIPPGGSALSATVQSTAFTNDFRYFVLALDSSGNGYAYISNANGMPAAELAPDVTLFPDIPAGLCVVGYIKVVAASGYTFTPGTTALNATGITTTYVNCSVIPSSIT